MRRISFYLMFVYYLFSFLLISSCVNPEAEKQEIIGNNEMNLDSQEDDHIIQLHPEYKDQNNPTEEDDNWKKPLTDLLEKVEADIEKLDKKLETAPEEIYERLLLLRKELEDKRTEIKTALKNNSDASKKKWQTTKFKIQDEVKNVKKEIENTLKKMEETFISEGDKSS